MKFETIHFAEETGIGILTIQRPEALNALNAQVMKELDQLLDVLASQQSLRVLLVTGAGEKAFVAGADIKEIDHLNEVSAKSFALSGQKTFTKFENLKIPVIAAVNGFALGGGLELALACDFIVASQKAKFGLPECSLGIMPGYAGTVRLPRRVGVARAKEMIFTGAHYTADEAMQMGLVSRVVEPTALLETAKALAQQMASRAPQALASIKRSLQEGESINARGAEEIEASYFAKLFTTQDQKEGTRAFIEKRKPEFTGK